MEKIKGIMVAAGILAAFSSAASAQTNVLTVTNVVTVLVTNVVTVTNVVASAPAPAAPVKSLWKSSVSAGLTLTRGNSDTMLFTADFLTEKKTTKDEYTFGAGVSYGNQNSQQTLFNKYIVTTSQDTVNNYKAFGQWNHLCNDNFFGYVRSDALRDLIANLDYRLTIGPGAGYYLIKRTGTALAVETGAGMEIQRLGGKDGQFATIRLAERFEQKFNDRARLWQKVELMPQVDELDNYVVTFEIGMEAAVSKSFSLKTCLDDSYANRPAAGHQKNDAKIVAGVSCKF